ncbi:MAG: hypothetical protein Q4G63_08705 [Bacteroidia bacterium]|nr:hypothetical protein [Bacteroidia bacterium]
MSTSEENVPVENTQNQPATNETPKRKSTRPKRSYAETVSAAQVMATGLKNNAEIMSKRGLDTEFVTALETDRADAITYNDEQEKLKADLKLKTEALDAKMTSINAKLSEARKIVKISIPKGQWKEFGIEDKR